MPHSCTLCHCFLPQPSSSQCSTTSSHSRDPAHPAPCTASFQGEETTSSPSSPPRKAWRPLVLLSPTYVAGLKQFMVLLTGSWSTPHLAHPCPRAQGTQGWHMPAFSPPLLPAGAAGTPLAPGPLWEGDSSGDQSPGIHTLHTCPPPEHCL